MIKKDNLYNLIAYLIDMLIECGYRDKVEYALKDYGFTDEQIKGLSYILK
jgi:hypothetical protein